MGFSPLGSTFSLLLLAPSLLLLRFPPADGLPRPDVPRVLALLERAGQALCVVVPVITLPGTVTWTVGAGVALALLSYHALWLRYLATGRRGAALYDTIAGVPVPMAVLPVAATLLCAAWLGNAWIALAGLVLGSGHIPASVAAARLTTRRRG